MEQAFAILTVELVIRGTNSRGASAGGLHQRLVWWIRQKFCRHGCHLNELRRTPDGGVECPCIRCGKMLTGSYGLMLECDWIKIPPNAELCSGANNQ